MIEQLEKYLTEFNTLRSSQTLPMHYEYDGGKSSFRIQICSIIHGNEVGSLPTVIQLIRDLESNKISFNGKISILLGNPEAAKLNRRFIDADLNRLFIVPQPEIHNSTHEAKRARELMPILSQCDLLLDLHQTNLASNRAFYIFPNSKISLAWAKVIGGANAYVDSTPKIKKPTYQCSDDFIWSQGKPALTLELGKAGFHEPAKTVSTIAIQNLLTQANDLISMGVEHNQAQTIEHFQNSSSSHLEMFETAHREPYHTAEHQLKAGLINFHPVTKGEVLSAPDTPTIIAPISGDLLFPKYPRRSQIGTISETLPKEIFRIINPA